VLANHDAIIDHATARIAGKDYQQNDSNFLAEYFSYSCRIVYFSPWPAAARIESTVNQVCYLFSQTHEPRAEGTSLTSHHLSALALWCIASFQIFGRSWGPEPVMSANSFPANAKFPIIDTNPGPWKGLKWFRSSDWTFLGSVIAGGTVLGYYFGRGTYMHRPTAVMGGFFGLTFGITVGLQNSMCRLMGMIENEQEVAASKAEGDS
jgi:hypothetical protein